MGRKRKKEKPKRRNRLGVRDREMERFMVSLTKTPPGTIKKYKNRRFIHVGRGQVKDLDA